MPASRKGPAKAQHDTAPDWKRGRDQAWKMGPSKKWYTEKSTNKRGGL